jgi:Uma2 family endonuclease
MLLLLHIKANNLGSVYTETGYKLETNPDTVLGPDVSFVAHQSAGDESDEYFRGAPDLAVEVLSSGDRRSRVEWKTNLWLSLGARSVWVVNPKLRTVEIARAGNYRKLFRESEELIDDTVPGFRVTVSEIFD